MLRGSIKKKEGMKMKKIISIFMIVILICVNLTSCIGAEDTANEVLAYDYSSFVGSWYYYPPDMARGIYLNIKSYDANSNSFIILCDSGEETLPIIDNKIKTYNINNSLHHNSDSIWKEFMFCDNAIKATVYSEERYINDEIEQNSFTDEYWLKSDTAKPRKIVENGYSVKLNGKKLEFDQPPVMVNDRVLVPMRAIFEAFNSTVFYRHTTDVDTEGAFTQIFTMNGNGMLDMYKSESYGDTWYIGYTKRDSDERKPIPCDVQPIIVSGRTLVPIRVISETLGAEVKWDGEAKTVLINGVIPEKWEKARDEEKINKTDDNLLTDGIKRWMSENGYSLTELGGEEGYFIGYDYNGKYVKCAAINNSNNKNYMINYYYDGEVKAENMEGLENEQANLPEDEYFDMEIMLEGDFYTEKAIRHYSKLGFSIGYLVEGITRYESENSLLFKTDFDNTYMEIVRHSDKDKETAINYVLNENGMEKLSKSELGGKEVLYAYTTNEGMCTQAYFLENNGTIYSVRMSCSVEALEGWGERFRQTIETIDFFE